MYLGGFPAYQRTETDNPKGKDLGLGDTEQNNTLIHIHTYKYIYVYTVYIYIRSTLQLRHSLVGNETQSGNASQNRESRPSQPRHWISKIKSARQTLTVMGKIHYPFSRIYVRISLGYPVMPLR